MVRDQVEYFEWDFTCHWCAD